MANITKQKKLTIIVCTILILALISVIVTLLFKDAVIKTETNTNKINNDVYCFINHKFTKGSDLTLLVMVDKDDISDDLIKLNVIIQQENNTHYQISNLNSIIISEPEMEFINNFVSYSGGDYSIPETNITDNSKKQYLYSDNYIYYTAIVNKDELETGLALDVSYNIEGAGLYFSNSFKGYKQSIAIQ